MSASCVFCGRPIAEGEPSVARPPMAAHASCADAALADDRHWDAIAEREPTAEEEAGPSARRSAGCLALAILLIVAAASVARTGWLRPLRRP